MELGIRGLGDRVQTALADSLTALSAHDLALADRVVRSDVEINRLRYDLESQASLRLAATTDWMEVRALVAGLYVLADLDRIGEHAEGIGKVAVMGGPSTRLSVRVVMY